MGVKKKLFFAEFQLINCKECRRCKNHHKANATEIAVVVGETGHLYSLKVFPPKYSLMIKGGK